MASERLKSLSYSELIQKYRSLRQYIRDVEEEIESRDKKSGDNTFPLFKENDTKKKVVKKTVSKKESPKKSSPKKESSDKNDSKNEIQIKGTIKIMKKILDDEEISYKSNITKDGLIKLIRENHLVRKCNSEAEKAKATK